MEGFNERIWNKMGEQSSRGLQLNITVRAADGRRGFVRIAYEHSLLSSEFRISRLNYQENKDTFSRGFIYDTPASRTSDPWSNMQEKVKYQDKMQAKWTNYKFPCTLSYWDQLAALYIKICMDFAEYK